MAEILSSPAPPYSSGIPPPSSPSSPAFFSSSAISPSLCCSRSGIERDHFLSHKLFGRLSNQPLIVGKIGGSENIFRTARKRSGMRRHDLRECEAADMAMSVSGRFDLESWRKLSLQRVTPRNSAAADRVLCGAFENARRAHAAADAHRDQAVARLAAFEFAQDCGGEFRAGAAERMSERDGAAIDDSRAPDRGLLTLITLSACAAKASFSSITSI